MQWYVFLNKLISNIEQSLSYRILAIFKVIASFIGIILVYLFRTPIALYWEKYSLYMNAQLKIPRAVIMLLCVVIIYMLYLLCRSLLSRRRYKDIIVATKTREGEDRLEIVRFHLHERQPKERAFGELLCHKCKIPFKICRKPLSAGGSYYCPLCAMEYTASDKERIVAAAQSMWIQGL